MHRFFYRTPNFFEYLMAIAIFSLSLIYIFLPALKYPFTININMKTMICFGFMLFLLIYAFIPLRGFYDKEPIIVFSKEGIWTRFWRTSIPLPWEEIAYAKFYNLSGSRSLPSGSADCFIGLFLKDEEKVLAKNEFCWLKNHNIVRGVFNKYPKFIFPVKCITTTEDELLELIDYYIRQDQYLKQTEQLTRLG